LSKPFLKVPNLQGIEMLNIFEFPLDTPKIAPIF